MSEFSEDDIANLLESIRLDEAKIDRYRTALEHIMGIDQKRQYGSCPDCDHMSWCTENKACKSMPHTEIGKIAAKTLAEGE